MQVQSQIFVQSKIFCLESHKLPSQGPGSWSSRAAGSLRVKEIAKDKDKVKDVVKDMAEDIANGIVNDMIMVKNVVKDLRKDKVIIKVKKTDTDMVKDIIEVKARMGWSWDGFFQD